MIRLAKPANLPHRILMRGMSGEGKTHNALALAICLGNGELPLLIDIGEKGKSEGYAKEFPHYIYRIEESGAEGMRELYRLLKDEQLRDKILIIDSLSCLWGMALEYKAILDVASPKHGMDNWNKINAAWDNVLHKLLIHPQHIIACVRMKQKMERIGKEWIKGSEGDICRPNYEFEFGVSCLVSQRNVIVEQPRHYVALKDLILEMPTISDFEVFKFMDNEEENDEIRL